MRFDLSYPLVSSEHGSLLSKRIDSATTVDRFRCRKPGVVKRQGRYAFTTLGLHDYGSAAAQHKLDTVRN